MSVVRLVLAVGVLVVLFLVVVLAALHGWRARAARQSAIPAPPPVPGSATGRSVPGGVRVAALYVSSTHAGDWLDRVVVHGLGVRSRASVAVLDADPGSEPGADPGTGTGTATATATERGIVIDRAGAPGLFIPAASLHAVRRDTGIAGKVAPRPELVVFTWDCGGTELDTGVRPGSEADRTLLAAAAADLIEERA